MPDLTFRVTGAEAVPFSVGPLLLFKLAIEVAAGGTIHALALRCQIRIEPARRRYAAGEQDRLSDLFGTPDRWGQTLRSLLWTHTSTVVPPFTGSTVVDLPVPCTYDFNVAVTKYFDALAAGEVALSLLFSGTIFHEAEDGGLQVAQIPWDKEATYRLPVSVWRAMMELYYPNSAWLVLHKDVFDRLHEYKRQRGMPTWEEAIASLLPARTEEVST